MNKYYIVIDGLQQGPFLLDELSQKNITKTTLVWTETMDNWVEASNVEELKSLIKIIPPPIPAKIEKPIKVETEISKKKEKLITPEREIVVAKEAKTNFKMILYALIIGAISYPIFFAIKDGFAHLSMHSKWDTGYFDWDTASEEEIDREIKEREELERQSRRLGWIQPKSFGLSRYSLASNFHEDKYKEAAENSVWPSILTAITAAIILILGRYIAKGAKWVEETSKKEI